MSTSVLICGDFCPQDRVRRMIDAGRYSDVFGNAIDLIKKADVSIVNLESPIVEDEKIRGISKAGPHLKNNLNTIEALKTVGFNVATLANNHFLDYGEEGAKSTFRALEENGLLYVGAGKDLEEASTPLVIEEKGKRLGFVNICEHEFSIASGNACGSNPMDLIALYNLIPNLKDEVDYLILIVHGGHEHYQLPSPRMKRLYRHFIDLGVDVVINHHQHCYSGYEKYSGKYIFYGLGNFSFDRIKERESIWNEGFMLELFFQDKEIDFKMYPYVQASELPGIVLMDNEKESSFYKNIECLNQVIANDELLEEEFVKWIRKNLRRYKSYLSPYTNRYMRYLCRLGLLPTNLTTDRINVLYDMIKCESHNDIILRILKNGY